MVWRPRTPLLFGEPGSLRAVLQAVVGPNAHGQEDPGTGDGVLRGRVRGGAVRWFRDGAARAKGGTFLPDLVARRGWGRGAARGDGRVRRDGPIPGRGSRAGDWIPEGVRRPGQRGRDHVGCVRRRRRARPRRRERHRRLPRPAHTTPVRLDAGAHRRGRSLAERSRVLDLRAGPEAGLVSDRKSTRLNSSHGYISYAVFCLKKKTNRPPSPHS